MKTNVLGYPRIGAQRELKKACESYWKRTISKEELLEVGKQMRQYAWQLQQSEGIDFIPSNDFSYYDQVLDASLMYGCIPKRFQSYESKHDAIDLYFAMARGVQDGQNDCTAMEMTKWFDTNYHYIVPEFEKNQTFELFTNKAVNEFKEALEIGIHTKPVLIGPVTFLWLGKESEPGFHRMDLLDQLLPVFFKLLTRLKDAGATYIQIDEPCLATDLTDAERKAITYVYTAIAAKFPELKVILTSYFDCYGKNLQTVRQLPVHALHLDLVRCPSQIKDILTLPESNKDQILSLGIVDGRNIWKNDFENSLALVNKLKSTYSKEKLWIATSCSLLHTPYDLDLETDEKNLSKEVKSWMAFSKQKVKELIVLKQLITNESHTEAGQQLHKNIAANHDKSVSKQIHHVATKNRVDRLTEKETKRNSTFSVRQNIQKETLKLPFYPTTTIGSFPQTREVRSWRAKFKKGVLSQKEYDQLLQKETEETIRFQEQVGLDVLVHGEFERNDMVEYFGERLEGFAFSANGWVQSYGSRGVKPPIIFGDVHRNTPMTVAWSSYAQSLTDKPVKGMLTGPVTILQWSFVRNDQPRSTTCKQIALAIRDEVNDLEKAGISVIQIDEPALREGLPLQQVHRKKYLDWAVGSFRIASSSVSDKTQIHTHMCYCEFNDIMPHIAGLDADVITIETSRSNMELLEAFKDFKYPNEIGPGVYDIHSPRIPSVDEMESLLDKASKILPVENLWVNPDCGLKTRDWPETKTALENLVQVARKMREKVGIATV